MGKSINQVTINVKKNEKALIDKARGCSERSRGNWRCWLFSTLAVCLGELSIFYTHEAIYEEFERCGLQPSVLSFRLGINQTTTN